jgi:ATP-binding cassette subfamily F protein 3
LGIIGPNGSGKTTFLKTILKKIPALGGEVRWGTKVQVGYYAQQLEDLDDRNEIIMELRRVAPSTATAGELRSFLAKFLFTGDDVYKHVRDLSGGEKGRLALAKLIYSRVNVLVLDEPTNHLDIPSREALEEALDAYEGTIITISHDRYFLDRVATQIMALDTDELAVHYNGDYTEYHDWRAARIAQGLPLIEDKAFEVNKARAADQDVAANTLQEPAQALKQTTKGKKDTAPKSPVVKVIKKKKPAVSPEALEAVIAQTEKKLQEISDRMSLPEVARDATELIKLDADYKQTEAQLSSLYEQWDQAAAQG